MSKFRPGDRIEKVCEECQFSQVAGYDRIPVGSLATVTGGAVSPRNASRGADVEMRVDGEDFFCDGWSPAWKRLDDNDSSGLSLTATLAALGQREAV